MPAEVDRAVRAKEGYMAMSEHGRCEKIALMIKSDNNAPHRDLKREIHNLAVQYMEATGEDDYSCAAKAILAKDQAIAQAYASYGRYGDSIAIKLPLRGNNGRQHAVSEAVLVLARQYMAKTGEKDLGTAAREVLRDNPVLAEQYLALTSK